ncbi:MAG: FHA domain-containing protein, partial [Holophagales bacterium]|nr:FHA domain-containing protein [Holophagales bacterium]
MSSSSHTNSAGRQYCLRGEISGVEQLFVLRRGNHQLGALESNEVTLPLAGVSRVHARLQLVGDGQLMVEDLASKNGTYVDGQRIRKASAQPGAELRFGPVSLRFEEFHSDDGRLAIAFEQSPNDQTGSFPIQEVARHTGTHISSLSRQWLVLAEAFQDRLLNDPDGDVTPALALLHEEMHLRSACLLELPADRDPVVLHAVGRVDDAAAQELKRLLGPFADQPPGRDIYYDTLSDARGGSLTLAALRPVGADPLVLALWGRVPGRLDSELFLRLLIRLLEARRAGHRAAPAEDESDREREYPGLIVPPDYVYGRSESMRQIYDLMQTLAQGDL